MSRCSKALVKYSDKSYVLIHLYGITKLDLKDDKQVKVTSRQGSLMLGCGPAMKSCREIVHATTL